MGGVRKTDTSVAVGTFVGVPPGVGVIKKSIVSHAIIAKHIATTASLILVVLVIVAFQL